MKKLALALLLPLAVYGQGTMPLSRSFLQTSMNGNQKTITNLAGVVFADGTVQTTAGAGGGAATNAYQSAVSGSGLSNSTNGGSFLYTFSLNQPLQKLSTNNAASVSNTPTLHDSAGRLTAHGNSMELIDPNTGWTNANWSDQTLSTANTNVLDWFNQRLIGNWVVDRITGNAAGLTNMAGVGNTVNSINTDYLPNLNARLQSQLPARFLFLRDDGQQLESDLDSNFSTYLQDNGTTLGAFGAKYYFTTNGLGRYQAANGLNTFWIGNTYFMANGSALTNVNGSGANWPATTIDLYFRKANGFGTLTVWTQAVSGTWGALRTIDANNGGAMVDARTNLVVPRIANALCAVTSSGTNIVHGLGQYDTNVMAGFSMSFLGGGDISIEKWVETSAASNTIRNFLGAGTVDAVIITDQNSSNNIYTGARLWKSMIRENGFKTDLVLATMTPVSGANTNINYYSRLAALNAGLDFQLPVLDLQGLFLPTEQGESLGYLVSDDVHLTGAGNHYISRYAAEKLGLTFDVNQIYGYTNRVASSVDLSGYAQLSAVNTAGYLEINGVLGSKNAGGYLYTYAQDDLTRQYRILASGSRLFIYDTTTSTTIPLFTLGAVSALGVGLEAATLGGEPPKIGRTNAWQVFGTNSQLYGANAISNISSSVTVQGGLEATGGGVGSKSASGLLYTYKQDDLTSLFRIIGSSSGLVVQDSSSPSDNLITVASVSLEGANLEMGYLGEPGQIGRLSHPILWSHSVIASNTASGFIGEGSGVTNLNASALASGTVSGARYGAYSSSSGPMVTTNGSGTSVLSFNAGSLTNYGGVKVYRALLTQTGTAAPSATVLENSIGAIVWARTSAGIYTATLSSAFTSGKTMIFVGNSWLTSLDFSVVKTIQTSTSVITVTTSSIDASGGGQSVEDVILSNTSFEVLVYP